MAQGWHARALDCVSILFDIIRLAALGANGRVGGGQEGALRPVAVLHVPGRWRRSL